MKKIVPLFLFMAFVLTGSIHAQPGERKGWPSVERYAFLTECIKSANLSLGEDAARFYCWCMQAKVELKYPTMEEAATIKDTDMQTPEWKQAINACLTGGTWADKDRADFLANCVTSAAPAVGEEKAKTYCACMLYKIELQYPNAEEAGKLTATDMATPAFKKMTKACMDF